MIRPRSTVFILVLVAALIGVLIKAGPASAITKEIFLNLDNPVKLTAESIDFDQEKMVVEAHGRVVIEQKITRLAEKKLVTSVDRILCEHARFNQASNNIDAWGRVIWYHGADILEAERLKLNLTTGLGKVFGGKMFISVGHFNITGREIDKVGADSYVVRDLTMTTCDGSRPDWLIKASWMNITVDGYAHLVAPRFHAAGLPFPFMALPYTILPAKTRRQAGFLIPDWSLSGRDGFTMDLPFYWPFAEWGELTAFWHHSAERGEGLGAELKFMLGDRKDIGLFYADFLNDRMADEYYRTGELKQDEADRYWIRGMFKASKLLPWGVSIKATVDHPSDPNFIQEFDYWMTSLEQNNREFQNLFGADLRDSTEVQRLNTLQLNKYFTGGNARVEFKYFDDPNYGGSDYTFHKLPSFRVNISDAPIGKSDYYYNFNVRGNYNYRLLGERGADFDAEGNLYAVWSLGPYLNLQPNFGVRGSWWLVDPNPAQGVTVPDDYDRFRDRYFWFTSLDLSTTLFRVFDIDALEVKRIKHQIRPRMTLLYVPKHYEPNPTTFAGEVGQAELINYGLSTTLTSKVRQLPARLLEVQDEMWRRRRLGRFLSQVLTSPKLAGISDSDLGTQYDRLLRVSQLNQNPTHRYQEWFRLELEQEFDLREARLETPVGQDKEPFSNLKAELWFEPSYYFKHKTVLEYHPYLRELERLSLHFDLKDWRGDRFSIDYRRYWNVDENQLDLAQVKATGDLPLFGGLSVGGAITYDFGEKKAISQGVSLLYKDQCWGIGVGYQKDDYDERFFITFSVLGWGEIYKLEGSPSSD